LKYLYDVCWCTRRSRYSLFLCSVDNATGHVEVDLRSRHSWSSAVHMKCSNKSMIGWSFYIYVFMYISFVRIKSKIFFNFFMTSVFEKQKKKMDQVKVGILLVNLLVVNTLLFLFPYYLIENIHKILFLLSSFQS
jgi:hypothetical protein